ncbi:3167_t:CDS:1, partial [Entrophospora sp. SA101]
MHRILQSSSKLREYNSMLRDKCIKQDEDFDQEKKGWDRNRKKWSKKLGGVVTENQNLQFENASKAISLANSKSEIDIKSKEITTLRSMIEILESKLSSAQGDVISIQNDSLKKESENLSLKSKIAELDHIKSSLESKVNELERLKSEAMSKPIVGGNDEKNITKSDDISAVLQSRPLDNESEIRGSVSSLNHDIYVSSEESLIRGYASPSKDLSQYFLRGKNMDPIEKID